MMTLMILARSTAALLTGGAIGLGFGMIQDAARLRNEKRMQAGDLKNIWSIMPGSGTRIAYLLVALAVIQYVCPLLFADGVQWWVSGGLVAGYGWCLFKQLRRRRA